MTAMTTVADKLKTIVAGEFASVGFVTGDTPEQIALGKSLPAGTRPPCVLILAGEGVCADGALTRRLQFHLVLIDQLNGSGDARAAAVWTKFDALLALPMGHSPATSFSSRNRRECWNAPTDGPPRA